MKMNPLGRTGIMVSELCLGTMTFGTQTPEDEAHAQIDMALAQGVNFLDTAEMYPVNPISADTIGDSERIIGSWNAATGGGPNTSWPPSIPARACSTPAAARRSRPPPSRPPSRPRCSG